MKTWTLIENVFYYVYKMFIRNFDYDIYSFDENISQKTMALLNTVLNK